VNYIQAFILMFTQESYLVSSFTTLIATYLIWEQKRASPS